ncbi:MAG: molybdenum cofactor guanylyltransferase [Solirubrobacteraceae bacterium]
MTAIVAVLAGGRGQRMGGAKPTAELAGRTLISYPLEAARGAGLEAVVVAKRSTTLPATLQERVLVEPEEPVHPLCGAIAALDFAAASSAPAVVLVACDMPFLTPPLLTWLANMEGAAIAEADGRLQPLLSRCLTSDASSLQASLAEQRSLTTAMRALGPRVLAAEDLSRFGDPGRLCFGVNDGEQLRAAEEWLT